MIDHLGSIRFIDVATLGTTYTPDLAYLLKSIHLLEIAYQHSQQLNWSLLYYVLYSSYAC